MEMLNILPAEDSGPGWSPPATDTIIHDPASTPGFTGVIQGDPKTPPVPSGYESDPATPGKLRPTPGGPADPNAGDTLDPKTVSFYAQQVLSGAPMPAMGMGKQASIMRQKVMEEVARQAGGQGLTGGDLARQITHYKAQSGNISNLEKQLGTVSQNEQTALANGQQFIDRSSELPGQTTYPILNSITQTVERAVGNTTIAASDAAYNTFVNEYAKVVAGSPNGAGTLSDSARREAMDTIKSSQSLAQKQAAFAQMKADMANRIAASHRVIEDSYKNLTQKPGYQVPDSLSEFSLPAPPPGGSDGGNGGGGGGDGPSGNPKLDAANTELHRMFVAGAPTADIVAFGRSHGLDPNPEQIDAARAKHLDPVFVVRDPGADQQQQAIKDKADAMMREGGSGGAAAIAGVADTVSMGLSDEFGAGVSALGESLSGHGSFGDNYSTDVGANRLYQQRLRGDHPIAYTGGQIGGGLMLPVGEVAGAVDAAKVGAAYGGAYGVGSGDNGVGSRIYGGALGAVVGGGAGAAGHAAVSALAPYAAPVVNKILPDSLASRLTPSRGLAPDVATAAQEEGVDLIKPMANPSLIDRFNTLRNKPLSGPIVDAGVNKTTGQIAGRVSDLGNGGNALEPQAIGDAVRGTGLRYVTQSGQQFNRLYGQIRQGIGDTKIPSTNLTQQIDGLISDLSETPKGNAKEIAWLQDLKADYGKDMSVDALRGLRTKIRQQIGKGDLTFGQNEARVASLSDAASQDILKGLNAAGKGDLAASFSEVDAAYRDRMDFIGGTVQKLIGKRGQNLSGEQVYQNLRTMAGPRGSASGIAKMRENMTPDEANDMAATFADALGKNAKGDFALGDLVKQTDPRKMPLAMRKSLFGDAGAQSLENLRLLAKKLDEVGTAASPFRAPWKQAARAFVSQITRFSPLAVGGGVGFETGSVGAGVGAGLTAAGVAGASAARNVLSARAMVNPRVSQWLAQAADVSTPSQAKAAVNSLRLVISREPALAHELLPIHQFLDQRVQQLLAANPQANDQNGQGQ